MMAADVVILPVVRSMRGPEDDRGKPGDGAPVTDINAFRYRRQRAAEVRREAKSLIDGTAE